MNSVFPPHLPPPASSLKARQLWRRLSTILIAVFFGMWAGFTGGALLLGWGMSGLQGTWLASPWWGGNPEAPRDVAIDEGKGREAAESIVAAYARTGSLGGAKAPTSLERLAQGAILSSDGWTAFFMPSYRGGAAEWHILGGQGKNYSVSQTVFDGESGFVYVKIKDPVIKGQPESTELFKTILFAENPEAGDNIFSLLEGDVWKGGPLALLAPPKKDDHLDSLPIIKYRVDNFPGRSVLVTLQGRLAGFTDETGEKFVPARLVEMVLPALLNESKAKRTSLGVSGWWGLERPVLVNNKLAVGFVVSRVRHVKSKLKRGDIIQEINGQPMTEDNLKNALLRSEARVRVVRGEKIVELVTPVVEL